MGHVLGGGSAVNAGYFVTDQSYWSDVNGWLRHASNRPNGPNGGGGGGGGSTDGPWVALTGGGGGGARYKEAGSNGPSSNPWNPTDMARCSDTVRDRLGIEREQPELATVTTEPFLEGCAKEVSLVMVIAMVLVVVVAVVAVVVVVRSRLCKSVRAGTL